MPTGGRWEIRLLGGLQARNGDVVLTHLPSRPIAALLARLALFPQREHAREELAELLWPGSEAEAARNRLRHALSTLRTLLEPAGTPPGTVLLANRFGVRLHAAAVDCDAVRFEQQLRAGDEAAARHLYRGELLPGFYDEWVLDERARLANLFERLDERPAPPPPRRRPPDDDAARHNILSYPSAFFGRDSELAALLLALQEQRLVTVSGTGGCGKTRLCAEAAARAAGFDSVSFVALAECREAAHLADHVRAALRLQAGPLPALEQVVAHLAGQRALLVLDNVEQLVGSDSDALLSQLLERLPQLHLLLSSRRALRRPDEHELMLLPLPVPSAEAGAADALRNPGVALFVDRARHARADFHIHARNVAGLVDLCRALDGLPLAIEIAASRVREYSPRAMCDALASGLAVLARTGPRAAKAPRHASLNAALQWSFGLLGAAPKEVLAALTVFRGGWTAEQAGAVAGVAGWREALDELVRDSLVRREAADGTAPRLQMMSSVREFVREGLSEADAAALRRRHRAFFLAAGRALDAHHDVADEADLPNYIEAMASALADGEPATAVALALALREQWAASPAAPEAIDVLRRIARALPAPAPGGVELRCVLARSLVQAGHADEAEACAGAALQGAGNDGPRRVEALFAATTVRWLRHRDGGAVLEPARQTLALARTLGDERLCARASMLLGAITLMHSGDAEAAAALFADAESTFGRLGDRRGALSALPGRVSCLQAQGQHEEVIARAAAGERLAAELRHVEPQLLLLNRLSVSEESLRRFGPALDACRRLARLARRHGMAYHVAYALWNQCRPLVRLRQAETAARLMAFSRKYWIDQFGALDADDEAYVERVRRVGVALLGAERWQALWAQGLAMSTGEGLDLGCG